jgi:hypothetical protein
MDSEGQNGVLFSDFIRLNPDPVKNILTIAVLQNATLMRIYLEDDDLLMEHQFEGKK